MFRSILLIILLTLTLSCGYEPMHSKNKLKNTNFSISKINFEGDAEINIEINEKLNRYKLDKKDKDLVLKIKSISTKNVAAKDSKGDPSIFNLTIKVVTQVTTVNNIKREIQFDENFKYDNIKDRFELKKYEKEIKIILAETITNNLIFKLSNLK